VCEGEVCGDVADVRVGSIEGHVAPDLMMRVQGAGSRVQVLGCKV